MFSEPYPCSAKCVRLNLLLTASFVCAYRGSASSHDFEEVICLGDINVLRHQKLLVLALIFWGTILYSFPPTLQPYSASVLNQFSNSYSLLFVGVSVGGLVGCSLNHACDLFGFHVNSTIRRCACLLGAIVSVFVVALNVTLYAHLLGTSDNSIPRWILLFAGTGIMSPSFVASFLAGLGFGLTAISLSQLFGSRDMANVNSSCSYLRGSGNALLCLSCLLLGALRGPLLLGLFPKAPAIFAEMKAVYGVAVYSPVLPFVAALLVVTPLLLLLRQKSQSIFTLGAFFLGDVSCRMMLRLFPDILMGLNSLQAHVVLYALLIAFAALNVIILVCSRDKGSSACADEPHSLPDSMAQILTTREAETIQLMLQGNSSSAIAEELGIKASSVRGFQQRAYKKLSVTSAEELKALCASTDKRDGSAWRSSWTLGHHVRWLGVLLAFAVLVLTIPCSNTGLIPLLANIQGWNCAWSVSCFLGIVLCLGLLIFESAIDGKRIESKMCELDLPLVTALPALTGLTIGELWRNATWPYLSFVSQLVIMLTVLSAATAYVQRDVWKSSSKADWVVLAVTSAFVCLYARTAWAAIPVVAILIYGNYTKTTFGDDSFLPAMICGGFALSAGLVGSAFLLTACEDALGRIIRLGLDDHQAHVDAVLLIVTVGVLLTASIGYLSSLMRKRAFTVIGTNDEQSPLQIVTLLTAMGLNETDARVGSLLTSGKSAREIAEELAVSPGTVNSSKRRVYARMQVHGAIQLKTKIELTLSAKNPS